MPPTAAGFIHTPIVPLPVGQAPPTSCGIAPPTSDGMAPPTFGQLEELDDHICTILVSADFRGFEPSNPNTPPHTGRKLNRSPFKIKRRSSNHNCQFIIDPGKASEM